jgi:membrane glycosyltransferase
MREINRSTATDQADFWKHMSRCYGNKPTTKHENKRKIFVIRNIILAYVIPFMIMLTSYAIIFKVSKAQSKKAYPMTQIQARRKSEVKAAKTIGLIIGAFIILYTPLYLFSAAFVMRDNKAAIKNNYQAILRSLRLITSFSTWINPVVYTFTNREFKEQFKKLFKKICRKHP